MKIIKVLFILTVFFAFAGNSYPQTDTTKTKKKNSSVKRVFKSYKGCKKNGDNCTYFELEYQVVRSGKAKNIINEALKDSLLKAVNIWEDQKPTSFKEAANNFIAQYDSSLKIQTNGASWYLETDGKVNSNGKNVLSYYVSQSMYTGGAHPNSYLVYYNFNKITGSQVSLKDIFGTGWEAPLNKAIDAAFRKEKGLSATDNLQEKAYLFENKITYTNNFAVEKKGLRFYYNNYDIAPYSTGPTEVFIPWSDLSGILPNASYYSK